MATNSEMRTISDSELDSAVESLVQKYFKKYLWVIDTKVGMLQKDMQAVHQKLGKLGVRNDFSEGFKSPKRYQKVTSFKGKSNLGMFR